MPESTDSSGRYGASSRGGEQLDLKADLDRLENGLNNLKIQYEQYFMGILPLAPEKAHQEIKVLIRQLKRAPFKSSAMNYRLVSLETRYQTYSSYWQRVIREREEGTYSRDIFKANMREAIAEEEVRGSTRKGKAEKQMKELFTAYKTALEGQTGKEMHLDFKKFHQHLVQSARELKAKTGNKKVSFSVILQDGKVKLKAKVS